MRIEKRLRYYCDHCKKSGGQKTAMISHESACTVNPDRVCKMCRLINRGGSATLAEMMAALPDPQQYIKTNEWGEFLDYETFSQLLADALPELRELAEGCPACILAALRQKMIPFYGDIFDFRAEMKIAYTNAVKAKSDGARYE